MSTSPRPQQMAERIVDAILARRLAPGARLGEQTLADLFGVSRTLVREAMSRLAARGIVEVSPKRGWFVVEPSAEDAREAFEARAVIETALIESLPRPLPRATVRRLRQHVAREKAAIRAGDTGARSFLLGDFHVCLAGCAGNGLLTGILKDLTARTTLIATLYQSTQEASSSCAEHQSIVAALEAGEHRQAVRLMRAHLGAVAAHLDPGARRDRLEPLRAALAPLEAAAPAAAAHARPP